MKQGVAKDISWDAEQKLLELRRVWQDYPEDVDQIGYRLVSETIDHLRSLIWLAAKAEKIGLPAQSAKGEQ
jgi:hypothetical protein